MWKVPAATSTRKMFSEGIAGGMPRSKRVHFLEGVFPPDLFPDLFLDLEVTHELLYPVSQVLVVLVHTKGCDDFIVVMLKNVTYP